MELMRRWMPIGLVCSALCAPAGPADAQVPGRDADPVVLKGSHLPKLAGASPGDVVGFRWTGSAWDQVPVQVDERAAVPYQQIYNNTPNCDFTCNNFTGTVEVFTDPDTWTGADPVATLDDDDEIAFMARDWGSEAPDGEADPAGVESGTRSVVELTDPLALPGAGRRFAYLFESTTLDPSAGESYVDYDFNLTSGDYKTTYAIASGPNPETSTVETDYYSHLLIDRWTDRELKIFTSGSSGVDILDGDKAQFHPTTCVRSEATFRDGEGAFITNTSGPVRAIRAYLGANSGPFTGREHIYYERRQDIRTNLRVHGIPGVMSFLDYSPAAIGMRYANQSNSVFTTNPIVDGVPEVLAPTNGGAPWEQVAGPQGTLDIVNRYQTDVSPLTVTSYWYDDSTPDSGHLQCDGDAFAYGSSGTWITSAIPNTDPRSAPSKSLTAVRHMFYDPPNLGGAMGNYRDQQITANLGVAVDGTTVIPAGSLPNLGPSKGPPPTPDLSRVAEIPPIKCKKGTKLKGNRCVKMKKKKAKKKRRKSPEAG